MITYESICEKLGFDFIEGPKREDVDNWMCDDSTSSPYSVLSYEEELWLVDHGYADA